MKTKRQRAAEFAKFSKEWVPRPTGENCPTCKWPIVEHKHAPKRRCSRFCESVNEEGKKEFICARDGDSVYFPCIECGDAAFGDWLPHDKEQQVGECCREARRVHIRGELLKKILDGVEYELGADLREEIEKELEQ